MKLTRLFPALALIAALSLSLPLRAQSTRAAREERAGGGGAPFFDRFRELVNGLQLSDEQKPRIDAILSKAQQDTTELRQQLQDLEPRERMQRMQETFQGLQQKINEVLTSDQKAVFEKKLAEMRQNFRGGGRPTGAGAANRPTSRPSERFGGGMFLDRLKENLAKLDLSDEQKTKIKTLFDEVKPKAEALRQQAQSGSEDARAKVRDLFEETRQKLIDVLTPDQRQQLMQSMRPPGGGGDGGASSPRGGRVNRGQRRAEAPATTQAAGMMMQDEMNPREKDSTGKSASAGESRGGEKIAGPKVGDAAPALELHKLDGSLVQLSSLKGRVIVLEFGSYSCPVFREKVPAMEKLKSDLGTRAQFFVVYAREAHPLGEWEVDRNKDAGISVEQPKKIEARRELAQQARDKLKITAPILLDGIGNDVAIAYGAGANSAYVIGRDGTIAARQQWCDPSGLRRAIVDATSPHPAATQATAE